MHPVNILRIFAFSLVLGHSILTIRYFNGFAGFLGHPVYVQEEPSNAK